MMDLDKENLENVYTIRSPMVTKQSVFTKPVSSPAVDKKKKSTVKSDEIARLKEDLASKNAEIAKQNEDIKLLQDRLRDQELAFYQSSLAYFPHRVRQIHSLTAEKAQLKRDLAETKAQLEHEKKQVQALQLNQQRQQRMQQYEHQQHHNHMLQQRPLQQQLAGLSNINYFVGSEDNYHPGEC